VFVALDFDVNSIFVMWNIAKLGFVVVGANFSVLKDSNTVSMGGRGGEKEGFRKCKVSGGILQFCECFHGVFADPYNDIVGCTQPGTHRSCLYTVASYGIG
jgi:hypothetical protein